MEHEDLERMGNGICTEDFFNLTDDNIYKSKVIKVIDINIRQLIKRMLSFMPSMSTHRKRNSRQWGALNRSKPKPYENNGLSENNFWQFNGSFQD